MAEIKDQTVAGRVDLDGNTYVNVVFENAALHYSGGQAPNFQNVTFTPSCSVSFAEQAGNTLAFLRSMAHDSSGMRFIVDGLMPEVAAKR